MTQHQDPVRASYEAAWSRIKTAVENEIDAGETHLARLLHKVYAQTIAERHSSEKFSILWNTEVPVPFLAANRIVRDWIADNVIVHSKGSDAIVETGSGYGYNLFNIWLRGGPDVPYYAFEYTDAGRNTALTIRDAVKAGPKLEVHPFNYYEPDLKPATGRHRRVFVYSSHSIEQINTLPDQFVESLLALGDEVVCIHFEPVGWQFAEQTGQTIHDYGQRAYNERHNYTKNLWSLLNKFQDQGRLVIDETLADSMSVKVYNGTSIIRWHSTSR